MKNLTDEEYIEKLKKDEGRRKKHAMLSIFILSLFSAPIIYYSVSIYSQAQELLFNLGSGDTTLENEALSYIEKNEKFILGFGIGSAISAACAFIGIFNWFGSYILLFRKKRTYANQVL